MGTTLINARDNATFFKKGTVVFTEGKPVKSLYLVKTGTVRLLKYKNSKLISVGICRDKDILNEVSVLSKSNHLFTAITETDTELVLVDAKDISQYLANSPKWVEGIFETLCERLLAVQDVIEEHQMVNPLEDPSLKLTKEQESLYSKLINDFLHQN